jgi:tetratricopeptide (TPR) repeat protein
MSRPTWYPLTLDPGVSREPHPDDSCLVLWLRGRRDAAAQHWERISNVPGAPFQVEQGLCFLAATAICAQQRIPKLLRVLLPPYRKQPRGRSWVLPTSGIAEQVGERQTDLLLVWPQDDATSLDEAHLRTCWPRATRLQRLGRNLFLVGGILPQTPASEAAQGTPLEQAEQLLTAARQSGDRRREVAALTDLGVAALRGCEAQRAVAVLEEALPLTREAGDRAGETDVLCHLGLAVQTAGQPQRGLEFLSMALLSARANGDRFAEKLALDHLGIVYAALRDHTAAGAAYEQAVAVARDVGDRWHQAELLWSLAIEHAELNEREQALALGQEAIDLFAQVGSPYVGWLGSHLQRYRAGEADTRLRRATEAPSNSPLAGSGWTTVVGAALPAPVVNSEPDSTVNGPGLLRLAISAVKSMAKFLGSGAKTVSPATRQQRLQICATCPHHTGLRCRVCGCFTNLKARLPHERCPREKWPQ